jgi:hypothetical protein
MTWIKTHSKKPERASNVKNCHVQNQLAFFLFCKFQTMVIMQSCSFLYIYECQDFKIQKSFFPTIGFGFS